MIVRLTRVSDLYSPIAVALAGIRRLRDGRAPACWEIRMDSIPLPHTGVVPPSIPAGPPFWTLSADAQCKALDCTQDGLSAAQAAERLTRYCDNADAAHQRPTPIRAVLRRLLEPLS